MKRDDVSKFIIAAIEQMEQQELLDQAMADVGGTVNFLKEHIRAAEEYREHVKTCKACSEDTERTTAVNHIGATAETALESIKTFLEALKTFEAARRANHEAHKEVSK